MSYLSESHFIPSTSSKIFPFMADPKNMSQLLASHLQVRLVSGARELKKDSEYLFQFKELGVSYFMRFVVSHLNHGVEMTYEQKEGFFQTWKHTQIFASQKGGILVHDILNYEAPMGLVGSVINDIYLKRKIKKILTSRFKVVEDFLEKS